MTPTSGTCLRKETDQPQVIATKGHLLGPAGDIESVTWNKNTLEISLSSGRRTKTQVLVSIPSAYTLESVHDCEVVAGTDAVYTIEPVNGTCKLVFAS